MKKRTFQIFTYRLPFREPLPVKDSTLTHREGLLIRLVDDDGVEGWGEIAPLPGFSRESLADVIRNGETVARLWCSRFPDALFSMRAPSIRFGIEQASCHIAASREKLPLHQMVSRGAQDRIRLCGLLSGDSHEQIARAIRLRLAGYRTVKIKIGRKSPEADAHLVKSLCDDLGADVRVRLDANRGWSLEDATRFCKLIEGTSIEFIEEPLNNPSALSAFHDLTKIPLALDETVIESKPALWTKIKGVAAVILKPTLAGGFRSCVDLANAAVSIGAMPVVSSSYESGVGTLGLAALAAFIQRPEEAAGLDPYSYFEDDLLAEPLQIVNGCFYLANLRHIQVRAELLKEVCRG